MKTSRRLAGAAILALVAPALGAPHRAQAAGSLYVFGDSLSDNGNLYKLIGYPPPPYSEGRFSNGPVWVQYLPGLTGLSFSAGNDYAYGGAFTGNITYNGVDYGTNLVAPDVPGISTEIAQFAATGQRFSRSDVVTLWGGANNYFEYADIIEANPASAEAIIAYAVPNTISQLGADTSALISLGAHTLLVPNLPDLGETPDFNSIPIESYLADQLSSEHNAALPGTMEALHLRTGANIIVLNEAQLLDNVVSNPGRYGFVNATDACIDTPACVNGSTATQNTYVFWDGVHPTTRAHDFIALYAAASLLEFESLTVPAQLGETGAQDFTTLLDNRMQALRTGAGGFTYNIDGASGTNGDPDQKFGLFVSGGGGNGYRNNASNGTDLGFTYTNAATVLGADYRFTPNITAGIALGYGDDWANVNEGGKVHNEAFTGGIYAVASSGPIYVDASFGYGANWYRTSRPGVGYGSVVGKPDGNNTTFDIEGGYNLAPWHKIELTPQLGFSYNDAALQGYTEAGDPLLTEQVSSQGYQEILATPGFTASTGLQLAGLSVAPYASAAAQIHLGNEGQDFTSSFTDEPIVTLTNTYPNQPAAWALLGAGASAILSNNLSANLSVSTTAFKANGNAFLVSGGGSYRF
jgi:outer membrane lipase/esterase